MREKCRGDLHTRGCEKCTRALGYMRAHRHGKSNSQSVWCADLSGPHSKAVGTGYTYIFVAVFHTEKTNLLFVRGLPTKTAQEGAEAIHSVLAELNSMAGEPLV
eukprot:1125337-Prorocentrum_lima.AAC.1